MTDAQDPLKRTNELHKMLSVDDVAAILSVSSKTVRRMIERGAFPTCRVGRLVRIQRVDLLVYIASCGRR